MALKGITVEINGNATALNKALQGVNTESKSLSKELTGVNKLLKLDPKNTELLAQKQTVLKQAVEQTESKLNMLTQAQEEMKAAGRDVNDEAYRELSREIEATRQKLKGYNDEQKQTKQQVDEVGGAFARTKQQIAENVKEGEGISKIKTAVKAVKQNLDEFKDSHPKIKMVVDVLGKVKDGAVGLAKALANGTVKALSATGKAAAEVANGGLKVLGTTISGTVKAFGGFCTAVMGGATAVAGFAVSQAAALDAIDKNSQKLGMSREEYQKWDFVLSQSGLSIESFGTGIKTLTAQMDAVSEGNEAAIENFRKLGVEVQNADGSLKGQEETLREVVAAFQLMPESTEKSRLATELFGRQGQELLPLLNSEAGSIDDLMAKCEELGIVIGDDAVDAGVEFTDALDQLKRSLKGIFNTLASTGILKTFTSGMQTAMSAITDLLQAYKTDGIEGALKEADSTIEVLLQQATEKIADSAPKMIEMISGIISSIITLIGKNIPTLTNKLLPPLQQAFFTLIRTVTSALPSLLPQVLDAAITLFSGLLQGLNETIPELMAMLPALIEEISQTLTTNLPQLVSAGVNILVSLISGITNAIPSLITAIVDLIPVIVQAVTDNLPLILSAGLGLLLALAQGITEAVPQLIEMLPTIINTIVETIGTMFPQLVETGVAILLSLITGITEAIPQLVAMLPDIISSIITTIGENLSQIVTAGIDILFALITGLIEAIPQLIASIPQIVTAIFTSFAEVDWPEIGKNIIDGIAEGIKSAAKKLKDTMFGVIETDVVGMAKKQLGIASPSKVMRDEVGKMIPAGLAVGVEQGMDKEEKRINDAMMRGVPTTIDGYIAAGGSRKGNPTDTAVAAGGGFTQNVTINSPQELSPSEVARQTRNATRQMALRMA